VDHLCRAGRRPLEFPMTLGRDFVGEVVECGLGVQGLRPGDQVWGVVAPHQQGSHAEYVLGSASTVRLHEIIHIYCYN
jgi:NADPH:quinone reductase-like Zn-dependent oxidoreductase